MFERFTKTSRRALMLAQEAARATGDPTLHTGHLVAGLARCGDPLVDEVLTDAGLDADAIAAGLGSADDDEPTVGKLLFTDDAKKALEHALREVLTAGTNDISPPFMLLGVLRTDGAGARLLRDAGVDIDDVRRRAEARLDEEDAPGRRALRARRGRRARAEQAAEGLAWASGPQTPGTRDVLRRLRRLAARSAMPTSTVDMLVAVAEEEGTLGAKVMAALGATPDAIREKAAEIGVAGTADEVKTRRRSRPVTVDLGGMQVKITDPEAIERLQVASAAGSETALADIVREVVRRHVGEPPEESGQ